jgi:hypothetical protein
MYSVSSAGAESSGFRLTDNPPILFDVRELLVMVEIVLRHSACRESTRHESLFELIHMNDYSADLVAGDRQAARCLSAPPKPWHL